MPGITFSSKVVNQRAAMGYTQLQLAKLAGVSLTTIGTLESGKHNISLFNAVAIASVLGIDPSFLMRP